MEKYEIIKALHCCQTQYNRNCKECPYEKYKSHAIRTTTCESELRKDLLTLVTKLTEGENK